MADDDDTVVAGLIFGGGDDVSEFGCGLESGEEVGINFCGSDTDDGVCIA